MNPDTGHLIRIMDGALTDGYVRVPAELSTAAEQVLAGRNEAHVSRSSGGKLSKWASKQRQARRQMARESRRRNQG